MMMFLISVIMGFIIAALILTYAVDVTIEAKGIKQAEQTHLEQVKKVSSEKPLLLSQYSKTMSKLKVDLKRDRDNRPDKALEQLDLLRDIVEMEYANKRISVDVYNKFSKVFGFILDLMTDSHEHWKLIKDANGDYKDKLKKKREAIVEKIEETTSELSDLVNNNIFNYINEKESAVDNGLEELKDIVKTEKNIKLKIKEFENFVNSGEVIAPITDDSENIVKKPLSITNHVEQIDLTSQLRQTQVELERVATNRIK